MQENVFNQWQVEYNSGIPVYRQIINQVGAAVAAGTLGVGSQLPTIRALSERLKVNPNTVAKAYRELEFKGMIMSERGAGSFVQAQPAAPVPSAKDKKTRLKSIYQRLLSEAASNGLTENDLVSFIKEKNTSTL
jgi:GntR family transcriptional regulator